jgi:electron transfer flavoprotein beta subunit
MAARTKPLTVLEAASGASSVSYARFELPQAKQGVKLINAENAGDLIGLLQNEAKVI